MCAKTSPQEIVEEHRRLQECLQRVHGVIREESRPASAVTLLDELHTHLVEHFALEEKGGYFRRVLRREPRLRGEAESLLDQHTLLLEALEAVRELASDVTASGEWGSLREAFETFMADLLAHERGEDHLIQEAYGTDIGERD